MDVQATNGPIISIKGLVKQYPKAQSAALKKINLEIAEGDFFGLIGPNGSGKTTLISILCGLLAPSDGEATIAGHNVKNQFQNVGRLIGLVPQDIALYPSLSVRQNLNFFGRLYGLRGNLLKERIAKYLKVARLEEFADRPVQDFSGGMKRRANLVTGLIHEPQIIFLDEPTVGVDPQSRNVIYEALEALNKEGKTLIYTTHYLQEAESFCKDVAVIDDGQIIAQGGPQSLIEQSPGCKDLIDVFLHLTGKNLRDQ